MDVVGGRAQMPAMAQRVLQPFPMTGYQNKVSPRLANVCNSVLASSKLIITGRASIDSDPAESISDCANARLNRPGYSGDSIS